MNRDIMHEASLYDAVCRRVSRITTRAYSTSFSMGVLCLDNQFRDPIYSIYGFVRFADEIVDTFHDHNKEELLRRFKQDTWMAIDEGISLNPILHSFQRTVRDCGIGRDLIETFLHSMKMDLDRKQYDPKGFKEYVMGSAEVVGLMCLRVFCKQDESTYERLKPDAMKLGAAFQKVNFLRDLKADYVGLGRTYFPHLRMDALNESIKKEIEADIERDFQHGFRGLRQLPRGARLGVYVSYLYYYALFRKICKLSFSDVMNRRIRVRNRYKLAILGYSFVKHQFNLI
jgi:phytoene synthase